jgi:ribonuclease E
MLINAIPPEEVRIAILEDGVLEELYVERSSQESFVGNIYKGKIVNIEPSIQAAFVDFGVGRNGFLHVSDVDPQYYRHLSEGDRSRKDSLLDILDIPEISPEEEAALEASALAEDDDEEEVSPNVEVIEDASNEEVTLEEKSAPRWQRRGDYERGPGERQGRDRGRRNDDRPRRGRDNRGPSWSNQRPPRSAPGVGAVLTGGQTPVSQPVSPPPPPQNVAESGSSGFGFGILLEPTPDEMVPPSPAIATEPSDTAQSEATEPVPTTAAASLPLERVTTNESSFDMEDFSFRPAPTEPKPMPVSAAERFTEEAPQLQEGDGTRESTPSGTEPQSAFGAFEMEVDAVESLAQEVLFGTESDASFPRPIAEAQTGEIYTRGEEPEPVLPSLEPGAIEDEPITFDDEPPPSEESGEEEPRRYRQPRSRRGDFADRGERGRGRGRSSFGRGDRRPRGPGRDFGRDGPNAPPKPPIQEIFRRGQEVLVQVIKEGIGTKGPTLSTYISIPGRYLVVMPGLSRIGVSRKIGDEQQRRRLRGILQDLQPPRGLGFIIRTAGLDRTKKELQRDLAYLTRLWRVIANRIKKAKGPSPIYQESDIITRTIRDIFTNEIEKIRVDESASYSHAREFMDFVMPRYAERLVLEQGLEPIFHRFNIESEIGNMQHKRVPLANGGSLVIDQTEAMVAIDVNSGQFRQESDAEENAFQMNLAAAKEVARQLRLRDLGGVIVIDFIDMRDERHRFEIERALRLAVSRDRARTKVLRMSQFGIIQMTRQRIRPSLKRTSFDECPACRATGLVKTGETMSIEVMRLLQLAAWRPNVARVRVRVADNVAQFLLNRKRKEIAKIEDDGNIQVTIFGVPGAMPETLEVQCLDSSGGEIRLTHETKAKRSNGK